MRRRRRRQPRPPSSRRRRASPSWPLPATRHATERRRARDRLPTPRRPRRAARGRQTNTARRATGHPPPAPSSLRGRTVRRPAAPTAVATNRSVMSPAAPHSGQQTRQRSHTLVASTSRVRQPHIGTSRTETASVVAHAVQASARVAAARGGEWGWPEIDAQAAVITTVAAVMMEASHGGACGGFSNTMPGGGRSGTAAASTSGGGRDAAPALQDESAVYPVFYAGFASRKSRIGRATDQSHAAIRPSQSTGFPGI